MGNGKKKAAGYGAYRTISLAIPEKPLYLI
jgi:hypothetical protein